VPDVEASGLPRIAQWVGVLQQRKKSLTDDGRIARMNLLIDHLAAERERDLLRIMRTISDRGLYPGRGAGVSAPSRFPRSHRRSAWCRS
jgi:hypothetical protein